MKELIAISAALLVSTGAWADPVNIESRPTTICNGEHPYCHCQDIVDGKCKIPDSISPDRSWHLLTKSRVGTVSLIKDLTKEECEFSRKRMLGLPATDEEMKEERDLYKSMDDARAKECAIHKNDTVVSPDHFGFVTCKDGKPNTWSTFSYRFSSSDDGGDIVSAECFQ